MVPEGPTITDHHDSTTPAALSIAQLIKFNSVKCKRKEPSGEAFSARHSVDQETPVLMYIGLMLHDYTCKKEQVDRLYRLRLSISNNCVLCLSAQMGNRVCEQFHNDQVVCPPRLRGCVFTTSAVDNISLFQHLQFDHEGVERNIMISTECQSSTV